MTEPNFRIIRLIQPLVPSPAIRLLALRLTDLLSYRFWEYINFKTRSISMGKLSSVSPIYFNFYKVILLWQKKISFLKPRSLKGNLNYWHILILFISKTCRYGNEIKGICYLHHCMSQTTIYF